MSNIQDKMIDSSNGVHVTTMELWVGYWQCPLHKSSSDAFGDNKLEVTLICIRALHGLKKNASKQFQSTIPPLYNSINVALNLFLMILSFRSKPNAS